ncbi:F-box only protein 30 isoform X2 [Eurytemora carolleeae]|uniref:F-box only protein 30 isoform X2 n=1 Tax=Eurytemora carolleeae TaxID=1294199 RepID=UPI000C755D1E|nr:F-box only protein 30 isoform X2 [Eurytemora carolleeae]|eukprot:XP_023344335.1 F-box only protein 30-like isoform X2 [Eurytemora affinis]
MPYFTRLKETEHLLLCYKEYIPCPNTQYGCSASLQRQKVPSHLPTCPANIIACTQEWNRWPLFCKERFKTIPFRLKNPQAARGDLDLELALRDQRLAGELFKVPRKTKLALRNNLTRRHPALPLPQHSTRKSTRQDRTATTLKDIVKLEVSDDTAVGPQYGIAKLFLKQQETQQRRWQEDVEKAILRTGQPVPKKYWEYDEMMKGNIHNHCAYCVDRNCVRKPDFQGDTSDTYSCSVVDCPFECGARLHHCKAFEHRMICANFEEEGEFDWILKDRIMKKRKAVKQKPEKPFPALLVGASVEPRIPLKTRKSTKPPPPPPPPTDLHRTVRFDIRVETVTRLQQKPRAMYTFICGQDLRRDQWEHHCKNVHNDIHGGLNNWLVARCPLSIYGCGFSYSRLYPGLNPENKVVFSEFSESFGIQPAPEQIRPSQDTDQTLDQLPVEILQIIFFKLDSWTLCQVSLTSRYLREVCASLLDRKGCVSLQWERTREEGQERRGWEVAYKRWFFSGHFDPVLTWGFNPGGKVSEHLKVCPYNDRVEHRSVDKTTPESRNFMAALEAKIKLKRDSEWFIQ